MKYRAIAAAMGSACVLAAAAMGQGPGSPTNKPAATGSPTQQATVETAEVSVVYPDRYAVPVSLEPNRKIYVVAPSDGIVTEVSAPVGAVVRANQTLLQLDRAEPSAKLKIADANVKEAQALANKAGADDVDAAKARLDAAKARAELAQIELTRCTIAAPFPGKVLSAPVSQGQYVTKRDLLAELGDFAILKVLVPVDRTVVKAGTEIELIVEGKAVTGKVLALVPLPENFSVLREIATPWAGAWVSLDNASGSLEPGQRVRGPFAPMQPITAVPNRALRRAADASSGAGLVQVIRNGNVLDMPVKVLGDAGFDRVQVSGAFLPSDGVIVESSLPMAAGTVIRFNTDPALSGAGDSTRGSLVDVTPPVGGPAAPAAGRVAPIGSPNASPKVGASGKTNAGKAATKPAAKPAGGGATPF